MRKTVAVLLMVLLAFAAAAQAAEPAGSPAKGPVVFDRFPDALGVYADASDFDHAFAGLAYQHWAGKLGLLASVSAFVSSTDASDAAAVAEIMYRVYAEDYASWLSGSLYLVGLGGVGFRQKSTYDSVTSSYTYTGPFARGLGGVGIGIEVALFGHFSSDLQFLYRLVYDGVPSVKLAPGFALTYRY